MDFSENLHDHKFLPNLKHGLQNLEKSNHGDEKRAKNCTLARQTLGATDPKLGIHTQLDSGSDMDWVPPGHTSSYWCVRLKMPKMELLKNTWTKIVKCTNPCIFGINVTWGMFKQTMAKWLRYRSTNPKLSGSTYFGSC